jgi:general secretion pathway protein A
MYLDFFGFEEKPFNLIPDPRFVFLSRNHKEAFAHLLYGINNRAGFIALTGEVGSGKTTVLRALLNQLDADHYRTALIFNPCISPPALLKSINREFGIPASASDSSSLLDALNSFLLQQNAEGRTVVLVIDEAQCLETSVLEQIRLISNLETDREKLIQIVLAGQPELAQMLKMKEMRQLSQRITVRYHLEPMDFTDTVAYVRHRLEVAGGKGGNLFSRSALKQIYSYSRGLPRLTNVACDRALLAGYAKDAPRIGCRISSAAIRDLRRSRVYPAPIRRLVLIPALVIILAFLASVVYVARQDLISPSKASQPVEATEKQPKKDAAATGEELSRLIVAELGSVSESESARRAFNVLAGLWNVAPVSESPAWNLSEGMERATLDRQLRLYRFSGNLGILSRINCPAALELTLPGLPGRRFVALTNVEQEKLMIDPPLGGRNSLLFHEMEKHWSGRGFLLWKDSLDLMGKIRPGSKGEPVKQLQGLLSEAGTYSRPLTGVYDSETLSAVKAFQFSRGLHPDGLVGSQTLMALYAAVDRFTMPRLGAGRK